MLRTNFVTLLVLASLGQVARAEKADHDMSPAPVNQTSRQRSAREVDTSLPAAGPVNYCARADEQKGSFYVYISLQIDDTAGFANYLQAHMASLTAAGGEIAGANLYPRGEFNPAQMQAGQQICVVQKWPSATAFANYYNSLDYRRFRQLRLDSTSSVVRLGNVDAAQTIENNELIPIPQR